MPNPAKKGERAAVLVRIPVATLERMTAAGLLPDRNTWIVDAIERKLGNAPG
jgi:hypothetical protein